MEIPDVQGLDKLYQSISEALEIEKCSICLERSENTVLLWPCTHWFCNSCITTLHKSAKGGKVTCPLCKCATTQRKVLPFQDKQTEYVDHLQSLIGALSLDLKFDVTSYNNLRKHEKSSGSERIETSKELITLSPLKKSRAKASLRVIEVKKKPDIQQSKKKPSRRSDNLHHSNISVADNNNKTQTFKSPYALPVLSSETPDSPKRKKVREWLDSNKFSQAEQDVCVETVVADVHKTEHDESLCFSETALQSVSQIDYISVQTPLKPPQTTKSRDTPSDIDAIKVCNKSSEHLLSTRGNLSKYKKSIPMPDFEKFDELFPENRKVQAVTTTYGSKNPYTSTHTRGQRFAVQVDLFDSINENKGNVKKSSPEEALDNSEETLEDFSSGSGEEWTIAKRPRKLNLMNRGKILKNDSKQSAKRKVKNSIEKYIRAKPVKNRNFKKHDFKAQKTWKNNVPSSSNNKGEKHQTIVKGGAVEEFSKPKDNAVKEIIDDWNDTKDSNNLRLKSQTSTKQNEDIVISESKCKTISENKSGTIISEINIVKPLACIENEDVKTPCKGVSTRSPGWSRLKSTKKEFHLSEKKKLSLKTFNKSKSDSPIINLGISALLNQSKSSVDCLSNTNHERSLVQSDSSMVADKKVDVDVIGNTKKQKTPELNKNLNTSLISSAAGSPFRGFITQEERKGKNKSTVNLDQNKEMPHKSLDTLVHEKSENKNTFLNENLEVPVPKEDLQEIDVRLDDQKSSSQCVKNNIESSKMNKASCKSSENCHFLETNNITTTSQEGPQGYTRFTKKRDRDSGIHNESGISSPTRKRVCRDAEVQTSPSRMHSVIRDMLKDMCGIELEEIMKQSNKTDLQKKIYSVDVSSPNHSIPNISQDSDKENVDIRSKNQNVSKKFLDDSDIVFGTEDQCAPTQLNPKLGVSYKHNNPRTQEPMNHFVFQSEEILDRIEVDSDASTHLLYKTPVVPKKPLQTSTKEYTVVSNPTSSELKRADSLFDKSDVIFPDDTSKGATPWNYSGVVHLEGHTGTVKKSADSNVILQPSQSLKEKSNRSRRQLDFMEENSNDIFDLEREISDKLREEVVNNKSDNSEHIDKVGELQGKVNELDDIFMESDELVNAVLISPDKDKKSSAPNEKVLMANQLEINVKNGIESENLSDTPGFVGPSEVQSFESRVNLIAPDKQIDKTNLNTSLTGEKPVICSPKIHFKVGETLNPVATSQQLTNNVVKDSSNVYLDSPFMFEQEKEKNSNVVKAREDDKESNPSSDLSYVEGTPDVSQNEEDRNKINNIENNIKGTDGQTQENVDILEVPKERERAKTETSLYDPLHKTISQSMQELCQQTEKEKEIDNAEKQSNQMIENTEMEEDNLCFASSLLNPQQTQVLVCVLGGMGLAYSKTVGPHISHLIVGTKNGCFQNTYKVLLAMALHKPIIRFDWVEEVIRTGGTVPLDPFIALDPSGKCGVLRAKADKNRELLQNFAIHIYNVNDGAVLKEQIEELVRLCGGAVVKELHHFCNIPRDKFRIIILSEPPDSLTQGDWRQKYSAVEVMIDWVYNTIGRYRVMPLVPFMVNDVVDAVPFLQHEGYPKELIFDLSTQE